MKTGITEEQFFGFLSKKVEYHTQQLEAWQKALEAIEGASVGGDSGEKATASQPTKEPPKKKVGRPKKTKKLNFGDKIVALLEKHGPMTGRDVFVEYKKLPGVRVGDNYLNFSGQLSQLTRKGVSIGKYAAANASRQQKNWYAPLDWFDKKGKLLPRYVEKIESKIDRAK